MTSNVSLHDELQVLKPQWTIRLVALSIVIFLIWASYAPLDKVVRGPGKVVPSSKEQVIQSLDGGILSEILVWEGKEVEKGEVLARLSDRRSDGSYREIESEVLAIEARLFRLEKELERDETLELPDRFWESDENVARSEVQFFKARREEYLAALNSLNRANSLNSQRVNMLADLTRKNLAPEIDLLNARQSMSESRAEIEALESDYQLTRSQEYAEALTELKKLKAALDIRKDVLQSTVLTSPTRAIVNELMITTIGGVAPPGEPILKLTPLGDDLRIEAKISPKDVAFIHPDMPATIKLTAYDYTIFGSLKGRVTHVSADTFEDQTTRDERPYYKVLVSVSSDALAQAHREIQIRPGMIADAELHAGQRTVLQYLLKPIFKASEAFREP